MCQQKANNNALIEMCEETAIQGMSNFMISDNNYQRHSLFLATTRLVLTVRTLHKTTEY